MRYALHSKHASLQNTATVQGKKREEADDVQPAQPSYGFVWANITTFAVTLDTTKERNVFQRRHPTRYTTGVHSSAQLLHLFITFIVIMTTGTALRT